MTTVRAIVDAFVDRINRGSREPQPLFDVPPHLRGDDGSSDIPSDWKGWRIVRSENAQRIADLEGRLGRGFPPSFPYLLSHYSFPAFVVKPLMLFANTGEETSLELGTRLFADRAMSPALLTAGLIQIGQPADGGYDPVCFDCNQARAEAPIVRLDHEAILQLGRMRVVERVAPSFLELLRAGAG